MTVRFGFLALAGFLLLTTTLIQTVQAQSLYIGPGGVQYNGFGQGYYGGYGQGYGGYGQAYSSGYGQTYQSYGRVYAPRADSYTVYGNGPYGYGSGSQYQFPANGYYGNSNYSGYSSPGFYRQGYSSAYSPYGFSYYGNGY